MVTQCVSGSRNCLNNGTTTRCQYFMDLQTYIKTFPRSERAAFRHKLADAHGVSEVTVRAWANATRRHPCTLKAVEITEKLTGSQVTRQDLRPEIFGRPATSKSRKASAGKKSGKVSASARRKKKPVSRKTNSGKGSSTKASKKTTSRKKKTRA